MKVLVERYTLVIVPENDQDLAFIEDTMGMSSDGDTISIERIDCGEGVRLESDPRHGTMSNHETNSDPCSKGRYMLSDAELSKFKDWGEASEVERTTSRNGGETLVDIQALDV